MSIIRGDASQTVRALTEGPKHHFFGFHDVCPWSGDEQYVLALETDFLDRPPAERDRAAVGVVDVKSGRKFEKLAETGAWNFQQGARAQWVPGSEDTFLFNDRADGAFVSVMMDTRGNVKKTFPAPVYAVSPDGKFGLGLNFSRLGLYGGYGYAPGGEPRAANLAESFPEDDGIFRIDFGTGAVKLIASVYGVAHLENIPRDTEHHYLTHIAFNPSGTRVACIHKWEMEDGGVLQRLVTMNPDGTGFHCLPGHVTHFSWRNETEILAYGKFSPKVMALRRAGVFRGPLLKPLLWAARKMRGGLKQVIAGQSYLLYTDKTREVRRIAVGTLTEDGHPSFCPADRNLFVTDTYPDKRHERTLSLCDVETGTTSELGKFYALPDKRYGVPERWDVSEMRSDLHPRWNRRGTEICFDSVHEGTKQMYVRARS